MHKLTILTALLAFIIAPATAQDLQETVEAGIATVRADNDLPAIGAIVMVDGAVQALAVEGVRRAGTDNAVTAEDKWHIGSITKSFTASLAALLVEDGELSWDDTLDEMLPGLAAEMDPQWHEATLAQLMNHTSGAPDNFSVFMQFNRPDTPGTLMAERAKAVAGVLAEPPVTAPGTAYQYSNIGPTIVGHIIETKLGISWEEAMTQMIFSPLGLSSAGFGAPTGDQPWGHGKLLIFRQAKDPAKEGADNTPIMGPAGTVHMSLGDLAVWGNHHMMGERGEADGFLSPESYAVLHTPALEDYAKGWVVWQRDWAGNGEANLLWHNGSNTMWYALLVLLPEKNAVIAIATNDGTSAQAKRDFWTIVEAVATDLPQNPVTGEE